nr:nonribosomal peptide synthetase tes [Quercus suber]
MADNKPYKTRSPRSTHVALRLSRDGVDWSLVRKELSDVLSLPLRDVHREVSFLDLGGDSVTALEFSARCSTMNIRVQVGDIIECDSLDELAARMMYRTEAGAEAGVKAWSLAPDLDRQSVEQEVREQCELAASHEISDMYPATALQEGLMALAVKQPGSYISEYKFALADNVDIRRFKAAWVQVIQACPILRTRIVLVDGRFWQVVVAEDVQWQSSSPDSSNPMVYGSKLCHYALHVDGAEHHFHLMMHHAVFDGWCLSLFSETLAQCYYNGLLPERSLVPFVNFVNYSIDMDTLASHDYWKSQLNAAKRTIFPSLHQARSAVSSGSATLRHNFDLPVRPKSVTMATVLRAAWAIVLAAYDDCADDVTFGSTVVGRQVPVDRIEHIAGPVISTVPVRVKFDQQQSVAQFLQDVQVQATEMIAFEQLGLQNIAKLGADAQEACQFSTLLVIQPNAIWSRASNSLLTLQDPALVSYDLNMNDVRYYNYPLVLQGHLYDDAVVLCITYDTAILRPEQVTRMARQYEYVVHQLLTARAQSEPTYLLGSVSLCGPRDVDQIMQWSTSEQPVVVDACVHDLVSESAFRTPQQEAIFAWDGRCTYIELDQMSTKVAALLHELGVGVESLVPVCFEKSMWTVVAMLAIMKAGGAFVPINPSQPLARRQALVAGLNAPLLLASPTTADACEGMPLPVIHLSASLLSTIPPTMEYRGQGVTPTNVAYVLFTSGSTGTPKGVVMEHRALASSIRGHGPAFGIRPTSRVLQFSSYIFDGCIAEIFTTLVEGGSVCIPSDEGRLSDVTGFIRRARVNWAMLTPSFVQSFSPSDVPGLETLILCGEAPTIACVKAWHGKLKLMNGYGPAETCVYASSHEIRNRDDSPTVIGHGCNSKLWLVEPHDHNRLAPVGCIGELLIQSPALAREYLNDREKTARSFIDSPSWLPPGPFTRLYKTGDLARYNEDGTIDYVGRKDVQIKIRGQRVEPGEIEYHVKQYLGPRSGASVQAMQDVPSAGSASLVVFMCMDVQAGVIDIDAADAILPKDDNMTELLLEVGRWVRLLYSTGDGNANGVRLSALPLRSATRRGPSALWPDHASRRVRRLELGSDHADPLSVL